MALLFDHEAMCFCFLWSFFVVVGHILLTNEIMPIFTKISEVLFLLGF